MELALSRASSLPRPTTLHLEHQSPTEERANHNEDTEHKRTLETLVQGDRLDHIRRDEEVEADEETTSDETLEDLECGVGILAEPAVQTDDYGDDHTDADHRDGEYLDGLGYISCDLEVADVKFLLRSDDPAHASTLGGGANSRSVEPWLQREIQRIF